MMPQQRRLRLQVVSMCLFCLVIFAQCVDRSWWNKKKHEIKGPIKTIVVVMMENRSFDHMLGWIKSSRPDIDGLTGHESNRLSNSDPSSPEIFVSDDAVFIDSDPGHSFQAIREQIFGSSDTSAIPAPMNGFAQQAATMDEGMARTVMSGFAPENVPIYTALANEFAVFDRWFASAPTSTQPNRFYVHSATSHGAMSNVRHDLIQGFPQKTIFDSLDKEGLSFGIYYQNIPATLFFKSLRKLKHSFNFHNYKLSFKQHARLGKLPNYVVIEQRYFDCELLPANDDHPSHDVARGQRFIKEIYETLRASPQWNETALLITYDEHGGFYDHVPTPVEGVPNPDGIIGPEPYYFKFDRLGVRVPTFLVSPWIEKGTVIHEPNGPTETSQFEHSSVPATVRKLFNMKSNFLTKRDAWAGTFESYFSLRKTPRSDCPEKLPEVIRSLRPHGPREDSSLSEFQEELIQLASQLNGDHVLNTYPHIGRHMTVGQANQYAEDAVARFLEAGKVALMAGANESAIVTMRPSLTSRAATAGIRRFVAGINLYSAFGSTDSSAGSISPLQSIFRKRFPDSSAGSVFIYRFVGADSPLRLIFLQIWRLLHSIYSADSSTLRILRVLPLSMESDESLSRDQDLSLKEPYIGQCFDNLDEVYTFYNAYARNLGFGIRKNSSSKSKVSGNLNWKNYVCDKAGKKCIRSNDTSKVINLRRETRMDCPAKLDVRKTKDDIWIVSNFIKEHNHTLDTPRRTLKHRSHHTSHRSFMTKAMMDQLHGAGLGPSNIAKTLNATSEDNSITAQNVIDHIRQQRKNQIGCQGILVAQYLQAQQAKDPNFFFAIELDTDEVLRSIFWADSRARKDYTIFGDVIVFDVTYKTNKLLLPFAPFTGVNHHRQSILLGCALLADETEETFTWLFQQWLKCMFGKAPPVIITDMDHAMYNSIRIVFPQTRHRFCSWHINKHLIENVYEMREIDGDFAKDYKKFYNSRSISLSEIRWDTLIAKYHLQTNKWLEKMWNLRLHWVPAFFKDIFMAGMTSTGRSESINSFFDNFVNSNTGLLEFFQQYEKALESRRQSEEVEDFKTMNSTAILFGKSSLEAHAAESYTRTIFNLFQCELKEVLCCLHEKIHTVDDTKIYLVGLSSEEKVKWFRVEYLDGDSISIKCDCSMFETNGIFCKHILHILYKKQVSKIPNQYMLKRWTVQARNILPHESSRMESINHYSVTPLMKWKLTSLCNELIEKVSSDEESFKSLYSYITQKLHDVTVSTKGKDLAFEGSQVGSTSIAFEQNVISIRDPIQARTKGRPKIASRIPSGIEQSKNASKKRTCGHCGDKGHYSTTCPNKK